MDIQKYIDFYVEWLKSEISFTKVGEYYEINENDFEVEITKNGEVVGLTISNKSKTPPPEKPKEETPKIEVPPIEPIKKLPVTGY